MSDKRESSSRENFVLGFDPVALCREYLATLNQLMSKMIDEESDRFSEAANRMSKHIADDGLIHVYGPGGHSNLAAQDVFFRAGGLVPVNAILDEGTLLSNGALRSLSIERITDYGKTVISNQMLAAGDLLILVSAYGVNSAVIGAALEARKRGVFLIGLSSHEHALKCPADHPSRHFSGHNLQDLVDITIDTKMPSGDACLDVPRLNEKVGPVSSFTNIFALNCLMLQTISYLAANGDSDVPIWRSTNAVGGDEANAKHICRFKSRLHWL